jgi:hypothetical protein
MTYTDILTYLSELTTTQIVCIILISTILTCIIRGLASSATDQNKELLDNMKNLDNKNNINQTLTK